ncbi:hypothetical protein EGW08_002583 [Elysia chlorotica]|uniref:Ig-like domain-containing protein n=1 Tax=Elysia chlorotica TaxID=188477 RepID=A0A433U772_ELYCH|nr:hypothetical protein EGW08_002583 [Elysia chlorotica]
MLDGVELTPSEGSSIKQVSAGISTLEIVGARYENGGSYACSVSHMTLASPLRSNSATLEVYGPPQLVPIDDQDITLPIGYNAELRCPVVSQPASQVSWLFQSPSSAAALPLLSTQLGVNIDLSTGTLVLSSVEESSSGVYTCTWKNQHGEVSKTVRLTVQGLPSPPQIDVTPSDVTVNENGAFVLNCSGYGYPRPSIEWLRNNQKEGDGEITVAFSGNSSADSGHKTNEKVISFPLSIKNVSRTDSGLYTCRIKNQEGQVEGSANVEVMFAPIFIVRPQSMTVLEGQSLTLYCAASGNPNPIVSWITPQNMTYAYHDAQPSEQNIVVLENGNLNIKHVTRENTGVFTCIAQNAMGRTSVPVTISMPGAPHFIKRPMSLGGIQGDQVTLACEVSAQPPASVVWYYKYVADLSVQSTNIAAILASITTPSGQLSVTDVTQVNVQAPRYSLAPDGSSLVITNLQESDAGFYVCHAQNILGSAFALAVIRVISFPQFQIIPQSSKVSIGDSILLDCYSVGIPVPTQRWLFQDRKLQLKSGLRGLTNGSLFIESITEEDLGKYTCLATNQAGQRSVSATLNLSDTPKITKAPVNTTVQLTESITLHCKGASSLPMQIFWYESNPAGDLQRLLVSGEVGDISTERSNTESLLYQVQLNSQGDLTIPCVDKFNVGWYLCQLRNDEGTATSNPVYVDVVYIPGGLDLSVSPNVPVQSQSVTLSCKAEGFPLPSLSWITPSKTELTTSSETPDGVSIQPPETDPTGALVSSLQIQSVESKAHGGEWMCKACNPEGCKVKTIELNIQGTPAIKEVFSEDANTEVSFTCLPSGTPSPEVVYTTGSNSSTVLSLAGHRVENNVMYVQKGTLRSSYSCSAVNTYGVSETVVLSPPPTVNIREAAPVGGGARLVFSVDRDIVSLAPTKLVVEWRRVETPQPDWSNSTLPLDPMVDVYMVALRNLLRNDTDITCSDKKLQPLTRRARSVGDVQGTMSTSNIVVDSTGSSFSYKIEILFTDLTANTVYEFRGVLSNALGPGITILSCNCENFIVRSWEGNKHQSRSR